MNIAFFDFDGTITRKDTLLDFIIYAAGVRKVLLNALLLSPALLLYALKVLPNSETKERVMTRFFRDWPLDRFNEKAALYSRQRIPGLVRRVARDALEMHRSSGDRIVVVTASMDNWIRGWCDDNYFELIATVMEVRDGRVTGKFLTRNCYGSEKVKRIKEQYNLSDYDTIYAYGDSRGDREMLAIADKKTYRWKEAQ